MKIIKKIQLKIFIFTSVKNRCILHGRVFVMYNSAVRVALCILFLSSKLALLPTLLQQLLTLLSAILVPCLVYLFHIFMFIFNTSYYMYKRTTSDIEGDVGAVKVV